MEKYSWAKDACLTMDSKNPLVVLEELMKLPSCHMHGPEHHVLVGSALLTAFSNAGGQIPGGLSVALGEMCSRGEQVPGGACGQWGACGAAISAGIFMSLVVASSPLAGPEWKLPNQMTAAALGAIGSCGGPRCCKRDSYLALSAAVTFVREQLQVDMEWTKPACSRSPLNQQCLGSSCPFHL